MKSVFLKFVKGEAEEQNKFLSRRSQSERKSLVESELSNGKHRETSERVKKNKNCVKSLLKILKTRKCILYQSVSVTSQRNKGEIHRNNVE